MRLKTVVLAAAAALVLAAAGFVVAERAAFDRDRALADLEKLLDHTASAYANLDVTIARAGIDPVALAERARAEVGAAATERGAAAAMSRFVDAFGDPHFRLATRPPAPIALVAGLFDADDGGGGGGGEEDRPTRETPPGEAVEALGYEEGDRDFRVDFDSTGAFERLPDDEAFPAGILRLRGGATAGVIRIGDFRDTRYAIVAARTWARFRETLGPAPCDRERAADFSLEVASDLLAKLAARIREVAARGVGAMVVDLTGNGGGREWCDAAARLFTESPLFAPRGAPIRHAHWVPQLERAIARMDEVLATAGASDSDRAALETEKRRLEGLLAAVRDVPDRRAIFRARGVAVPPLLAEDDGSRLPPDVAARAGLLPVSADWGTWRGPLVVLVDRRTASASEHFVAMLRDAGAARVVGSRTYGAGHGYSAGGIVLELAGGRITVRAPDAARLRRDGTNEVLGIEPDTALPGFDDLSGADRARKVIETLE